MINSSIKQEVEYLIQENHNFSLEKSEIEQFLNKEFSNDFSTDFYSEEPKKLYLKNPRSLFFICYIGLFIFTVIGVFGIHIMIYNLSITEIIIAIIIFIFLSRNDMDNDKFYFKNTTICMIISFCIYLIIYTNILIFIPICVILFLIFYEYYIINSMVTRIQRISILQDNIETNCKKLINLSTPSIIALVHRERMADVHSIQAHGFYFLPTTDIHDILNQHLHEIERIPLQNNTILYKSKINSL